MKTLSTPQQIKRYSTFLPLALLAFSVASITVFSAPAATLSGATGSHDPSRMILCDGKYYVYSTGGGMKCSSDGINWTSGPSPFATTAPAEGTKPGRGVAPASVKAIVPEDRGIWAPDIIFYNNKYCLYYSVAAPLTISHCAIGLLTSPTLDPAAPNYRWTDAGVVISTWNKVEKKSAIDPCPFVDAKGDLWMSWGSGYANGSVGDDPTIIISKLDNATGLRSKTDTHDYPVAPGHIEGSYVHYRAGYYYAFWNDGGSGPPPNATYRIHVARSEGVTGPYVNKAGKVGAGDIFMTTAKEKDIQGPGHMGIESEPGIDRFTFHYYNAAGRPVLGIRTLVWGPDGWPSVGEDLVPGAYKITAENGLALAVRGDDSADGAAIELQPDNGSAFQNWIVTLAPEGYHLLKSVGSGKSIEVAVPAATAKNLPPAIAQATAAIGANQRWIIELTSDGKTYRLKSCSTHEALAFPITADGASEKTAALTTATWNNMAAQKWVFGAPSNSSHEQPPIPTALH